MHQIRRRALAALGVLALLAGVLGATAPAQAAGTHTITVRLSPVKEGYLAVVSCGSTYSALSGTDANGQAVFTGVPDGASCNVQAQLNIVFLPYVYYQNIGNMATDYASGTATFTSNADQTVLVNLPAATGFKCDNPTSVIGDPAIGHPVSASTPTFSGGTLNPASLQYIWFRMKVVNGHIVATAAPLAVTSGGGTIGSPVYTPTAADAGQQLLVIVAGSSTGSPSKTAICDYNVSGVVHQAGTPAPGMPSIQGKGKVGKKLTAVAPALAGASVSYQWFRSAKKKNAAPTAIPGATGPTYKAKGKDRGKRLFVAVTYTKAPDGPTTVLSNGKKIH